MERNDNVLIKELLERRALLVRDNNEKKISEEEFNARFKVINDELAVINNRPSTPALVPEAEVRVKKTRNRGPNSVKAKIPVVKAKVDINAMVEYLKEQARPKDTTKEVRMKIIDELKKIKDSIVLLQDKIKKM